MFLYKLRLISPGARRDIKYRETTTIGVEGFLGVILLLGTPIQFNQMGLESSNHFYTV